MKIRRKTTMKIRPIYIWLYILAFLIIYTSGSTLTSFEIENSVSYLGRYLLIIIIGMNAPFLISNLLGRKYSKNLTVTIMGTMLYWIISYLAGSAAVANMTLRYALFVVCVSMAFYFYRKGIQFGEIYFNIIFVITIIALIFFCITTFSEAALSYTTMSRNLQVYRNYFNVFFTCNSYDVDFMGLNIRRLQSLFWEPGVFAVHLNFALYYFIFEKKDKPFWQLIILICAMVFTVSTTGLIVAVGLLALYFQRAKAVKSIRKVTFIPLAILAAGAVLYIWLQKKAEAGSTYMSYGLRMGDLYTSIAVLLQHPVFGTGYKNDSLFVLTRGIDRGNSNGLLAWCYQMGILGILLVYVPFIHNIRRQDDKESKLRKIVFLVIFIINNMTEPLFMTPIMIFYIASEYVEMFTRKRTVKLGLVRGADYAAQK